MNSGNSMAAAAAPVVETTLGRIRGRADNNHAAFLGIRYATAARFGPPVDPTPQAGVTDALAFGAIAPQTNPAPSGPPPVILAHLPRPEGAAPPPPPPTESEDCLFLNVWTPRPERDAKLPVMVWLHGGFFYSGSGAMGNGSHLAARGDVVVVSLNHRLNAFGFTHFGDLAGGAFPHAGNAGMLDVVAALEWVQANIEGFGGDPARVMVFGNSGGGMKTGWLMASPRARGLLHRAGVQSGPALRFLELATAAEATDRLLRELSIRPADAADLVRVPTRELLGAYYRVAAARPSAAFTHLTGFAPVLDSALLPAHPYDPEPSPHLHPIPLLIGVNADEMSFFMGNDQAAFALDEAGLTSRAKAVLGAGADATIAHYRSRYPGLSPARLWVRMDSDRQVLAPTLAQADKRAAQAQAPVFAYRFEQESPLFGGALGATHTLESAYVLGQLGNPLVGPVTPEKQALSRAVGDRWVSFAADGVPGADWPAYSADATLHMLGEGSGEAAKQATFTAERGLFQAG